MSLFAKILVLAVVYCLSGRLGLLLAVPPGNATAIWPPAGIALAGLLLWGPRCWVGVWLGALGANLTMRLDPTNLATVIASSYIPVLTASGATLQAVVGAWACRRYIVFPNALERARDIGVLLALGGPVACLISATVGVGSMALLGIVASANIPVTALTWWLGDCLGVLVFTPILLILFAEAGKVDWRRRMTVGIALFGTLATSVVLYRAALHVEQAHEQLAFEKDASLLAAQLTESLASDSDAVATTGLLFDTTNGVSRDQFRRFAHGMLVRHPGITGLTWVQKLDDLHRKSFEAQLGSELHRPLTLLERDPQRHELPAAVRPVYFPIVFPEPFKSTVIGFDVYSDPVRRATMHKSIETGLRQATPRLTPGGADQHQYATLIFQPVFLHGAATASVEDRQRNIQGFVVGSFLLPALIETSTKRSRDGGIALLVTDDDDDQLLYDSRTDNHQEATSDPPLQKDDRIWQTKIGIAGRSWTVHCVQRQATLLAHQHWGVWLPLVGGLLFTALVGVFVMVISARTNVVQRLVWAKTREIRANAIRHQQLVDGVQDYAIYWLDVMGRIESWNSGAQRIKGYAAAEIIGRHFSIFYTEEDRSKDLPQQALNTALATGHYLAEGWRSRKDGTLFWASVTIAPLHAPDGTHTGFAKVTKDNTQRRQFENAIQASEETFRSAMENASIGMALIKPSGEWIEVNNALVELTGYTKAALLAADFRALTHPEDLLLDEGPIEELLARIIPRYQVEKRFLHEAGHTIWVLLSMSLVHDADGVARHFVAQIQDITVRKQVDRLKSEFIGTVSHELRTPLTSIRGSLGLINGGAAGALPEKAARLVEVAYHNTARLTRIINDILDVEKIEAGQMSLDLQPHALAPLIRQAIEENRGYAQAHEVQFTAFGVLPEIDVRVDAGRLLQVLANFMSNAAKFSPKGGVVEIGADLNGKATRVWVRDHGMGIPKSFQPLIFQRFCQADGSDTRAKGGTGLGLNIAKALVEQMGGTIGYYTAIGSGTTFYIDLQVVHERAAA